MIGSVEESPAPVGTTATSDSGVRLHDYRPERNDLRVLIELAAPVTLVQIGLMSMGAVDTVMVGRVSAADLAAVALGNLYFFIMAIFGQGVLFALDPVISQAVGARDPIGVARGVQRGLILATLLSAVAMLLLLTGRRACPRRAQYRAWTHPRPDTRPRRRCTQVAPLKCLSCVSSSSNITHADPLGRPSAYQK